MLYFDQYIYYVVMVCLLKETEDSGMSSVSSFLLEAEVSPAHVAYRIGATKLIDGVRFLSRCNYIEVKSLHA